MYALRIIISDHSIEVLKAALRLQLPAVKSSHRCEALARGLGFNSYASMLSARDSNRSATLDDAAFIGFLSDRGVMASSIHLHRAAGVCLIKRISDSYPALTIHGIGVDRISRKPDGSYESVGELVEREARLRAALMDPGEIEGFLLASAFLARVKRTKTVRPRTSSYRLKHITEKYRCRLPDGSDLGPCYVTNGSFIAAAICSGFAFKQHVDGFGSASPNVNFNMSVSSINELDREIRPDRWQTKHSAKRMTSLHSPDQHRA